MPLSTLAFATIPPQYRVDATSVFSLVRNVGSGVGISLVTTVLAQMSTVNHAELAERVTLNSPAIRELPGVAQGGLFRSLGQLDGLVSQQSAMIAYLDDFWLMMIVTLLSVPFIFLLRKPKTAIKIDPAHAVSE